MNAYSASSQSPSSDAVPIDNRAAVAALLVELAKAFQRSPSELTVEPDRPSTRVPPERILLTPEEAGGRLGLGRTTVYTLMKTGELESVQIGRLRRIPTSALHEYAARLLQHTRSQEV